MADPVTLLIAPYVPEIDKYFVPYVSTFAFTNPITTGILGALVYKFVKWTKCQGDDKAWDWFMGKFRGKKEPASGPDSPTK